MKVNLEGNVPLIDHPRQASLSYSIDGSSILRNFTGEVKKGEYMKVTQIKSFPITDEAGRLYFIVKVETDNGIYGLGEVGIARWGAAIGKAIEHLSQIVVGQDPFSSEKLWQHMFRGNFFPADKVYMCAMDNALINSFCHAIYI